MKIEHVQLALQIISVIGVPILTAMITWITNSLRKTNLRIDELQQKVNDNRIQDLERLSELTSSIKAMEATQQASMRETHGVRQAVNRIESFLLNLDKKQ